jgi:hypothetical protein
MNIQAAAHWLKQGKAVKRREWSLSVYEDNYHPPYRMSTDRRVAENRLDSPLWNHADFTVEDLLAVDWEIIDE